MPNPIFGNQRTRSQLTLPNALLYGISERSPLKDAKSALRRNGLLGALSPRETRTEPSSETEEEDELLLSPQRPATPPRRIKRSASPPPTNGADLSLMSPSRNRESKRPKLELLKGSIIADDNNNKRSSMKHVRSLSVPESSLRSLTGSPQIMQNASIPLSVLSESSSAKRARSVPVFTASPFIDLRKPPSTPLRPRSPSKPAPLQINIEPVIPNVRITDNLPAGDTTSPMHVDGEHTTTTAPLPIEQTPKRSSINQELDLSTPRAPSSRVPDETCSSDAPHVSASGTMNPPTTPANTWLDPIYSDSPLTPVPETPFLPKKAGFKPKPSRLGMISESSSPNPPRLSEKDTSKDSSGSSGPSTGKSEVGRTSLREHEKSPMGPPALPFSKREEIVPPGLSTKPATLATGKRDANIFLMDAARKRTKLETSVKDKQKQTTVPTSRLPLMSSTPTRTTTVPGGTARNNALAGSSKMIPPPSFSTKGKEKAKDTPSAPKSIIKKMKARSVIKPKTRPVPVPRPIVTEGQAGNNANMADADNAPLPTAVSETSTLVDLTDIQPRDASVPDVKGKERAQDHASGVDSKPDQESIEHERELEAGETVPRPPSPTVPHSEPDKKDEIVLPLGPVTNSTKEAHVSEPTNRPTEELTQSINLDLLKTPNLVQEASVPEPEPTNAQGELEHGPFLAEESLPHDTPMGETEDLFGDDLEVIPSSQEEATEVGSPQALPDDMEVIPSSQEEPMDVASSPKSTDPTLAEVHPIPVVSASVEEKEEAMAIDEPKELIAPPKPNPSKTKASLTKSKAKPSITKRAPAPAVTRPARVTRSVSLKKSANGSTSSVAGSQAVVPKTPQKQKSFAAQSTIADGAGEGSRLSSMPDTDLTTSSLSDAPSEPKSAPASPVKGALSNRKPGESSYARPTFSASNKQAPFGPVSKPAGSPTKLVRSASMHTSRPTGFLRTITGMAGPPSSLSTLENALEKLQMPAPARPNTSLGFNRDDDDDDDHKTGASTSSTTGQTGGLFSSTSRFSTKPHSSAGVVRPNAAAGPSGTNKVFGTKGAVMRGTGTLKTSGSTTKTGLAKFGITGGPFAGMSRARLTQKASKKTSLPMVIGSPVKGERHAMDVDMDLTLEELTPTVTGSGTSATNEGALEDGETKEGSEADRKKKRLQNASRRVSIVSQALSQSLHEIPTTKLCTTLGNMGPPGTPPGKGKAKADSESQATPSSDAGSATSNSPVRRTSTRNLRSANKPPEKKVSPPPKASSGKKAQDSAAVPESLKILKDCVIFVDVRTDDGDDAGSLFVEMLESVGARILTRVGQTCTHIVFKNGLMSTLNRYRLLRDPKPLVVGIAWVVECIEQRKKVDEAAFLVDVEGMNVAGINKRRRSMLPKFISRAFEDDVGSSDADRDYNGDPDTSLNRSTSSIIGDGLTPLERARMRKAGEI